MKFEIKGFMCRGCGACVSVCERGAVSGSVHKPHKIDQDLCDGCGACLNVCSFDAVKIIRE